MLRVSHCLDRLFELIRSGGSQLVLFQVCTHVPPTLPLIGFSIRPVSDSVQCLLWSGGTFSVASSQSSLSLAMEDYCFNQPDIVNYPFHRVKMQVKTNPILPRLHLTWDTSPRPAVLNYTTSGKFLDFQHTAKTLFLSERKDKETDFKRFKVLLKHTHTRSDTQYLYRLRYWHFLPDHVSVRRDRSKSDIVQILFCVIVKPQERHKNIIKHHEFSCTIFQVFWSCKVQMNI